MSRHIGTSFYIVSRYEREGRLKDFLKFRNNRKYNDVLGLPTIYTFTFHTVEIFSEIILRIVWHKCDTFLGISDTRETIKACGNIHDGTAHFFG